MRTATRGRRRRPGALIWLRPSGAPRTCETSGAALPAAMARDHPQLRKLAIVPAYNEQGMVGRVVRDIHRQAPDFDVVVVDDGSTDDTAAEARGRAARSSSATPSTSGSAGRCSPGFKYALRNDYDVAAQVDGDGQHKPAYLDDLLAKLQTTGDEADMVCGSRFRGDPGYKVPIGRRVGNLIFSVVLTAITPPADHRPDLRLPDDQPPRDRAVRPRLPARLPRGRGDPDAPRPPPAHPRGARADERARLRHAARSTTPAAPTTWPRCCWRSSSACSAAARPRSRSRPTRVRATGPGAAVSGAGEAPRGG